MPAELSKAVQILNYNSGRKIKISDVARECNFSSCGRSVLDAAAQAAGGKMNMDIVKTPELLIAIADESYGLKLKPIEAEIMLGYLEGSDFCLLHRFDDRLDCEVLRIHDNQSTDEDSCEDVNKILQIVEFCRHANEVILSEQKDLRNPPDEYVRDLRKDEAILDRLYRASVDAVAYANLHRLERIFKKKASEA